MSEKRERPLYEPPRGRDLSAISASGLVPLGICDPVGTTPATACEPTGQSIGAPIVCTPGGWVSFGCHIGSVPTLD